jgi:hypothetical protein
MNDSFDDIFNRVIPEEDVTEHEPEVEAQADIEVADPETPVETTDEPTVGEEGEKNHSVPLATFLDMRDKNKEAKAELDAMRARLADLENSKQTISASPDPLLDPRAYTEHLENTIKDRIFNERLLTSYTIAQRNHSKEDVDAAKDWAIQRSQNDPAFDQAIQTQIDPVEWVLQQHKAVKAIEEYTRDPIAAAKRIAMEQGWLTDSQQQPMVAQTTMATTQPKTQRTRTTSLTDIPAASGKATPENDKEIFDSAFNPR